MFAGAGSVRSSAGHVDRLHGGDRAGARRGDALLQLAHLGGQRRLVADGARHAAEERRHLRARLHEAEDVVDEEQHVLALLAEVLGHREAGQRDAEAGSGRLVHLAVDERDLVEHAGLLHLEVEVVALARALADTGEHGHAAVGVGDVVDQLHDRDGLADAGAAEEADLAALDVRRDQVDDLDARSRRPRRTAAGRGRPAAHGGSTSARRPRSRACRRPAGRSRSRCGRASSRRPGPRSARPCRRRPSRARDRRWNPWRPRARGRRRGAAAPPRRASRSCRRAG